MGSRVDHQDIRIGTFGALQPERGGRVHQADPALWFRVLSALLLGHTGASICPSWLTR